MKTIKIGIIGTGRIGRVHAMSLVRDVPGVEVTMVADPYVDNATAWLDELGIAGRTTDYKEIIAKDEIDAVYICSVTSTHAMIMVEAARAGKDIFCEKPIDLDIAKVREALETVKECGVRLQLGFNRRFDPSFRAVRDRTAAGEVGPVDIIKISSRDPEPPPIEYVKGSGGMFLDMTIHDFDMARFLAGSEVTAVHAAAAVRVDPAIGEAGDVDTAIITLWFESGAMAVIDNSRAAIYGYDQRIEVFGRKGMLRAENNTPTRVEYFGPDSVSADKPLFFFLERYADAYSAESRAFVEAIRQGTEPEVTGIDGLLPLYIGTAAGRSYKEKRVVTIDEVKGE